MPEEAALEQTDSGLKPAGEGWFVLNVAEAAWMVHDAFGSGTVFESREFPFTEFGINISVMQPGQPLCLYHGENAQEDFLVLAGRCVLVVEEQERELGPWDFFHSPPRTAHMIVGAGNDRAVVLAVGTRGLPRKGLVYPVSDAAARHGVSVAQETRDPAEAYADLDRPTRVRYQEGWLP